MSRLTYQSSGVDIRRGDALVRSIKGLAKSTRRSEVLGGIGGFGGLFQFSTRKYRNPVLVSSTDGVGTKLLVAQMMNRHHTIGLDLVAMCVNDVAVTGAEPLFFLDYFATGKIRPKAVADVIKGIARGCRKAGCALLGGETAEMPSFYAKGQYDIAGFAVGVVEKSNIIDGRSIRADDVLVGLSSSGLHSNGYSLARKVIFEKARLKPGDYLPECGKTVGEELLIPTRIYSAVIQRLLRKIKIKGIAHITGGGITENLPRILPKGCMATVSQESWPDPPIFDYLKKKGKISTKEMYRVFNMGIGMILVISPKTVQPISRLLTGLGEKHYIIGHIGRTKRAGEVVYA